MLKDDLVSVSEERSLLADFCGLPFKPFRFKGWEGKRETVSYGWRYDFDGGQLRETIPLPSFLTKLRNTIAGFAGLTANDLVQALITKYETGAGIGWHRDRPEFEHVVGISFGSAATMRLRRRTPTGFRRASFDLTPRAAYHLSGEIRHAWEHSIAETSEPRWSVTFHSLSNRGRELTATAREVS